MNIVQCDDVDDDSEQHDSDVGQAQRSPRAEVLADGGRSHILLFSRVLCYYLLVCRRMGRLNVHCGSYMSDHQWTSVRSIVCGMSELHC